MDLSLELARQSDRQDLQATSPRSPRAWGWAALELQSLQHSIEVPGAARPLVPRLRSQLLRPGRRVVDRERLVDVKRLDSGLCFHPPGIRRHRAIAPPFGRRQDTDVRRQHVGDDQLGRLAPVRQGKQSDGHAFPPHRHRLRSDPPLPRRRTGEGCLTPPELAICTIAREVVGLLLATFEALAAFELPKAANHRRGRSWRPSPRSGVSPIMAGDPACPHFGDGRRQTPGPVCL